MDDSTHFQDDFASYSFRKARLLKLDSPHGDNQLHATSPNDIHPELRKLETLYIF